MEEYKRDCRDEILWTDVDQLHDATLQISKSCFEYKKLCVGLIGAAVAVILKFTDDGMDESLFVVCLFICLGFWLADGTAYYYQRVLRRVMDTKLNTIGEKNYGTDYDSKESDYRFKASSDA